MYIANEHIPVKKTAPSPRQAINLARRQEKQGQSGKWLSKEERASKFESTLLTVVNPTFVY